MALRRSSDDHSFSSSYNKSLIWIADTRLIGSKFHDPYRVATVVIEAVFLFALSAVSIGSMTFLNKSRSSKVIFKWYRYTLAIYLTFVVFIFSLIHLILEEKEAIVATFYHLVVTIIDTTVYAAEIVQLITVFAIITQLNKRVPPLNFLTEAPFAWTYGAFCAILSALFIVIYTLNIQSIVETIQPDYSSLTAYQHTIDHIKHIKLNTARILITFDVLYAVASLAVLALAGWTLTRSLKEQDRKQKRMSIFLVTLVAIPLFVRSTIQLGLAASYSLSLYIHETKSGALAEIFFYYFCTVLVFAGIVLIGYLLSKDVPEQDEMLYGPEAGTMMDDQHDGSAYITHSQQGYIRDLGKEPQVSQHPAPVHRAQNDLQTGGEQANNGPKRRDAGATACPVSPSLPVSPVMNGYGAPHAMNW